MSKSNTHLRINRYFLSIYSQLKIENYIINWKIDLIKIINEFYIKIKEDQ